MTNIKRTDKNKDKDIILIYSGEFYYYKGCNIFQETCYNSDIYILEGFSTIKKLEERVLDLGLKPRYLEYIEEE